MAKKDDSKTAGKTAASTKKAAKKAAKKKVSKKQVAKKKVATKKATGKKVTKKTTVRKTPAKKVGSRKPVRKSVSEEDRRMMIAMHAYYKWEQAGFPGGQDWQHWLEAEKEVDEILGG